MSLYAICKDYEKGTIEIKSGEKISLKQGDYIHIRIQALGCPEGYADYSNVKVVSVRSPGVKGALGCPGGKLQFEHNGGWHGISGNGILSIWVI